MRTLTIVALVATLGCDSASSNTSAAVWKRVTAKAPDSSLDADTRVRGMDQGFVDHVVPLTNGAAYVSEMRNGVWYIRGDRAQRVTVVGPSPAQDSAIFQNVIDFEIAPTPDGRAYASSSINKAVWLLEGAQARRVREGPMADTLPSASILPNRAPFWFAAFTNANTRANKCADDARTQEQMDEASRNQEQPDDQ